jgi:hypothetical protein
MNSISESNTENVQHNILYIIIDYMNQAQALHKDGYNKKNFVLKNIKLVLGEESYCRYLPYIDLTIDMIKIIANNKELLSKLKMKNCLKCYR